MCIYFKKIERNLIYQNRTTSTPSSSSISTSAWVHHNQCLHHHQYHHNRYLHHHQYHLNQYLEYVIYLQEVTYNNEAYLYNNNEASYLRCLQGHHFDIWIRRSLCINN